MNAKVEHTPPTNQNPVLSVDSNGTIIHSNEASEPILKEWGVGVGEKLSSSIVDIVQRVISRNSPEKTEVKVGNKLYLIVFHPLPEQECVNISGFDISAQEESEEKVLESEEKYRTLINSIDEGFFLIDVIFDENDNPVDMFYVESNAAANRMLGMDYTGKRLREIDPNYEFYWYEIFGKVAKTGQSVRMEQYADPDKKWYSFYVFKIGGPNSRRIGNIFQDITKRKLRERQQEYLLKLSDALRPLSDAVEIETTACRLLGEHLGVNRVYYPEINEAEGYAKVERDFFRGTSPSMAGKYRLTDYGWSLPFLRRGEPVIISNIYGADGIPQADLAAMETIQQLALVSVPLVKNGTLVGALTVSENTPRVWKPEEVELVRETLERTWAMAERARAEEALRLSEEKFRTLSNTAPALIWYNDKEGNNVFINQYFINFTGMTAEEIQGTGWHNLVHPDEAKAYIADYMEGVCKQLPWYNRSRIRRYDGIWRWHDSYAQPLFSEDGTYIGHVGVSTDVTPLVEAEEALKIANITLEERVRERTSELEKTYKFLHEIDIVRKQEIHHRIKNNLQVISSLLDIQAEKFSGKKSIKDSEVLEAFKESQDRVISMALIHEELHKGGEIDTLNFSAYIHELSDNLFLSYRLGNDGISLNMDIEEDIFFDMDISIPLGMIVNELVSNSLKHAFSDRDKGEIRIKLHREKNGESDIEDCCTAFILSVSDNGIGIPKDLEIEDLDSLGFQLVTTLVEQLDGELELKKDNGTEFIVRFSVTERNNQQKGIIRQIRQHNN